MKVSTNAVLLVKYAPAAGQTAFVTYRVNKGRNVQAIVNFLIRKPEFRFASMHQYNRKTDNIEHVKQLPQIGYIDRRTVTGTF